MGAPKQKWTEEEEIALKAGVLKHGAGKWRAIQKDPSFRTALSARTNVDLKDKWRNLNIDSLPGKLSGHGALGEKRGRARSDFVGNPKIAVHKAHGRQRHDSCHHNQLIDNCKKMHFALPSQLKLAQQALLRSEDVILAAIISLDCSRGSSCADIVHWAQKHCGNMIQMEMEINTTLDALVTRHRLSLQNGRYTLGGALSRFVDTEQYLDCSNQIHGPKKCRSLSQDTVVCLASYAALAVGEAEKNADYAEDLTIEADKLANAC